jgi:signal transduction histidine kinase
MWGRMERDVKHRAKQRSGDTETVSLTALSLVDVVRCIAQVRELAAIAASIEHFAQGLMECCQHTFRVPNASDPEIVLGRCFVACPFRELSDEVQAWLQQGEDRINDPSTGLCLSLVGSAGLVAGWNDPTMSSRYRAIPMDSKQFAVRFPMFAEVFRQIGISVEDRRFGAGVMNIGAVGGGCNVFHVPLAIGSPFIPAQNDFVRPYGIRSVVGFGGWYGQGQYFLVVMFSRVSIPTESVELLRLLALAVRVGFNTVSGAIPTQSRSGCPGVSHIQTLEELLTLYENTVEAQDGMMGDQRDQLRALAERVMTAQEDERSRVASELHDHVVSELGGIVFGLRSLIRCPPMTKEEMMTALERVVGELEELSTSARELSFHLHPVMLDRVGISCALNKLLDDVSRRTGLRIERTIQQLECPLLPMASAALYRVVEEAIQNVIKHAQVDRVQLHLSVGDETVVCRVRDEGRGFQVHRHRAGSAGLGLLSMAERIRQVGGQLQLESEPGKGTQIEVRVPCANTKRMVMHG